MATKSELEEAYSGLLSEIDTATTEIGDRITQLVTQLAEGGMSREKEVEIFNELRTKADRLKAMGKDEQNPIPTEDEQPASTDVNTQPVQPAEQPGETGTNGSDEDVATGGANQTGPTAGDTGINKGGE